jgi:hypothetical protein
VVNNLIINGDIVNPPSSITCFRELTLIAKKAIRLQVFIECQQKDYYFKYLKNFGAMDYIDDILLPGEETGMRIDNELHFSPTIYVTDHIDHYNIRDVLNALGFNSLFARIYN